MAFKTDALNASIRAALEAATRCRAAGDQSGCIAALTEAWRGSAALPDAHLLSVSAWRLAKAHHDFGDPYSMLEAVRPLVQTPLTERQNLFVAPVTVSPFTYYPASVGAASRVCRHFTDRAGYADPLIALLYQALSEHHRQAADPYLAARAQVELAWWHACRGEQEQLWAIVERYLKTPPAGFEREAGPDAHRHAQAPDISTSLFHIQLDLARTALRCATWTGNVSSAVDALELMEDAAEDIGHRDLWFLDAACHAGTRFDELSIPDGYFSLWRTSLDGSDHAVHRGLMLAILGSDASLARQAGTLALSDHRGPEWAAMAFQIAHAQEKANGREPNALADEGPEDALIRTIADYGVTAFSP